MSQALLRPLLTHTHTHTDGEREATQSLINHFACQKTIMSKRWRFKHETKVGETHGLTAHSLHIIILQQSLWYDEQHDDPVDYKNIKKKKACFLNLERNKYREDCWLLSLAGQHKPLSSVCEWGECEELCKVLWLLTNLGKCHKMHVLIYFICWYTYMFFFQMLPTMFSR